MVIITVPFLFVIVIVLARIVLIFWDKAWISTKCNIIEFDTKRRCYPSKFPDLIDDTVIYWVKAKYSYIANNSKYTSTRISLDIFDKVFTKEELDTDAFVLSVKNNEAVCMYLRFFPRISVLVRSFTKGQDQFSIIIIALVMMSLLFIITKIAYGFNLVL